MLLFSFCNFVFSFTVFIGSPVIVLATLYVLYELLMYQHFLHEHRQQIYLNEISNINGHIDLIEQMTLNSLQYAILLTGNSCRIVWSKR